jgi:hypothetical protein
VSQVALQGRGVRPTNRFVLSAVRLHPDGTLTARVKLPGPGVLSVNEKASPGARAFARLRVPVRRAGTLRLKVPPTALGRRLISARRGAVSVDLSAAFTPKGGKARTKRVRHVR